MNEFINQELKIDNNFSGFILSDFKKLSNEVQSKLLDYKIKGYELLDTLVWCEKYLNNMPSEIVSNEYLLSSRITTQEISLQKRLKRLFEFLFALFLLFLITPFVLVASFFIKIEDGGSIFYSQIRSGFAGKKFRIWKLRSMKINAEKKGIQWAMKMILELQRLGK